MKLFFFLVFIILGVGKIGYAQSPNQVVDYKNVDLAYLEHLVKEEVDQLRAQRNLAPLLNDSILYLAAGNQNSYNLKQQKLSHTQQKNKAFEDPQLRIEYYGAMNVYAGENVLYFPVGIPTQVAYQKETISPSTYLEYAQAIAMGWKHSKHHYSNIVSPDYSITGVHVLYDEANETLWAAQVFGQVVGKYSYTNQSAIFKYSTEAKKKDDSESILKAQFKYPFGLKKPSEFDDCPPSASKKWENMEMKLNITQDQMILCVYDLKSFSRMFGYAKDGLAVELIGFSEEFACGSELKLKPNTRNGYGLVDGELFKPVYRNNILKQVEKLEAINRSRPQRRGELSCNYIQLGPTTEPFKNHPHEAVMFYIRRKKLCTRIATYGYCGELLQYKPKALPYILNIPDYQYIPKESFTWIEFQIEYKKNQTVPNSGEVDRIKKQLGAQEYNIEKIEIEAFASIEGTANDNERLFERRAQIIIDELEEIHEKKIPYSVVTKENWQMFRFQMESSQDFQYLAKMPDEEARNKVNELLKASDALEGYLQHERYAKVRIKVTPKPSTQWNIYRALRELKTLLQAEEKSYQLMNDLYGYVLKNKGYAFYYTQDEIDCLELGEADELALSNYRKYMNNLMENPEYHDGEIIEMKLKRFSKILKLPEIEYNLKATMANYPEAYSEKDRILLANSLSKQMLKDGMGAELVEDVNLWYHFELAALVFRSQYSSDIEKANPSLEYIHDYYLNNEPELEFKLQLAKFYLAFDRVEWVAELLEPLLSDDNFSEVAYILYLKHCTQEEREKFPSRFAVRMTDAYQKLGADKWCSLFIGDCKIPISAFQNPTLRSLYCESCDGLIYHPVAE
ncbi:MAG: hypothetical protein KDC83_09730 [Flavobacteriales bacterium]|nr:hypothetical protein [Flavobacteriales bacterium]